MSADEFVICINCGREVPKTQYCIYCGHNMVRLKDRPKQNWNEGKISENSSPFKYISKQETEKSVWPAYEQPPEYHRFRQMKEEKESEINYLIKESLKYYFYKVKLYEILILEGMPQRVFSNILQDYNKNIEDIKLKIDEKKRVYQDEFEKKKNELEDATLKVDEMKIRVTIGEITDSDLLIRTQGITEQINSLSKDISRLDKLLRPQKAQSIGVSPKEIFEYEETVRGYREVIDDLIISDKISRELGKKLETDMQNTMVFFSSLVQDDEIEYRNELEMLEARYKVGEISESELNEAKKKIKIKLTALWEDNA